MVPRTTDGIADHKAFGERAVIVAAVGGDGEDFGAVAGQQHLLVADMAQQHAAIGKIGEGNAPGQIGTAGLGVGLSHGFLHCFQARHHGKPVASCPPPPISFPSASR